MKTEARALKSLPLCMHDGFYTATSRYDHRAGLLRFVLICDGCGSELREAGRVRYRPRFESSRATSVAA
jgi:hypothetical protein